MGFVVKRGSLNEKSDYLRKVDSYLRLSNSFSIVEVISTV
jgi:hypothetical protein